MFFFFDVNEYNDGIPVYEQMMKPILAALMAVSYTHLTLPTILLV